LRIKEVLSDYKNPKLELFSTEYFEFVTVFPPNIVREDFGFSISDVIEFKEPVGIEVYKRLQLDKEYDNYLSVNYRNIKISKKVFDENQLENCLKSCFTLIERVVNQFFNLSEIIVEKSVVINSETLDENLEVVIRKKELEKRGEVSKPFGIIHAKNIKDASDRCGSGFVPIYWEKDRAYLFEDKNVYLLLPYDFANKLLKLNGSIMKPFDQFTEKENEILEKFYWRKYLKKASIAGKIHYFGLNKKTRKILIKGLKNI
jgi:hypothetical protein